MSKIILLLIASACFSMAYISTPSEEIFDLVGQVKCESFHCGRTKIITNKNKSTFTYLKDDGSFKLSFKSSASDSLSVYFKRASCPNVDNVSFVIEERVERPWFSFFSNPKIIIGTKKKPFIYNCHKINTAGN